MNVLALFNRRFQPKRREDPFGLNAALAYRKANRDELQAQARSDAAKRGWVSRRAGA
jgi:hypothetical protein